MMWQAVTIQQPDGSRSPMGDVVPGWSDVPDLVDVPARIIAATTEDPKRDMTLVEDTYEIALRPSGDHTTITSKMRVLDGTDAYDIRRVEPKPIGLPTPETLVHAVKVAP